MPQADAELTAIMAERFGDNSDRGPIKFLEDAGYTLTYHWLWEPKPGVTTYTDMTQEEWECLLFLVHEWDFGGLLPEEKKEEEEEDTYSREISNG